MVNTACEDACLPDQPEDGLQMTLTRRLRLSKHFEQPYTRGTEVGNDESRIPECLRSTRLSLQARRSTPFFFFFPYFVLALRTKPKNRVLRSSNGA